MGKNGEMSVRPGAENHNISFQGDQDRRDIGRAGCSDKACCVLF